MTTNLIEQAKAMAERLERVFSPDREEMEGARKLSALIRQLIAQSEGGFVEGNPQNPHAFLRI